MELVQNIWTRYGFRGNPFDTAALSAMAEDILPIAKAIVGRGMDSPESKMLLGVLRSAGGGRAVVEGDIGVGKTTFLNCLPASPRWSPDLLLCQPKMCASSGIFDPDYRENRLPDGDILQGCSPNIALQIV